MHLLNTLLKALPEYQALKEHSEHNIPCAITGLGAIHRAHMTAALHQDTGRQVLVVCQDDLATARMAEELTGFLGETPPVLPTRELCLLGGTVSRGWEQQRLGMLYQLTQGQLAHLLLPVGDYDKPAIRESARQAGLLNADKADSQDICFVPDGDYTAFLQEYGHVTLEPGNFVDREGRVLGRHKGLPCYTTGQRKGLGVSAGKHVYVVRKNARDNTILLGDDRDLFTSRLTACRVNWIAGAAPADTIRVTAKTRYSQTEAEAAVTPLPDGRMEVVFDRPQRAVTAGQAVVLYDGDQVLGGGVIED